MKQVFLSTLRNRSYLAAFVITALLCFAILVLSAIEIRHSDIQVPLRYSAFGITHIYRESWLNELLLPLFAIGIFVAHTVISLKFASLKHITVAIAFQWLTAIMLSLVFMTLLAIFKIVSVLQ